MPAEPKVIQLGDDPSLEWNTVRRWITDHYNNAEVMASLKAEDDALDAVFLGLLTRWYADAPDAGCFEIGVNEKIGTVRLRLGRRDTKAAVNMELFVQELLAAGVGAGVIAAAQQAATVEGKEGKPYPRFDKVVDNRDRGRPALRAVK